LKARLKKAVGKIQGVEDGATGTNQSNHGCTAAEPMSHSSLVPLGAVEEMHVSTQLLDNASLGFVQLGSSRTASSDETVARPELRSDKNDASTGFVHIGSLPAVDADETASRPEVRAENDVKDNRGYEQSARNELSPGTRSKTTPEAHMLAKIQCLKAERDAALATAAEQAKELAASHELSQELQRRCDHLLEERDALSRTVEQLQCAAEAERRRMQELEKIYPHLGAAFETIGKLLAQHKAAEQQET